MWIITPASAAGWFVLWQRREAGNKSLACLPLTSSEAHVQMSRLPIKAGFLIRAALSPGYSSSVFADLSALTDYCTSTSQQQAHANTQRRVCFWLFITVFPRNSLNKHGMVMHLVCQSPVGPLFLLPGTMPDLSGLVVISSRLETFPRKLQKQQSQMVIVYIFQTAEFREESVLPWMFTFN